MRVAHLPGLIGVIHLPPLAGSPGANNDDPSQSLQKAGLWAVREAKLLTQAGFEGLILENFGDAPFYKAGVPAETIASLSVIAAAVREATRVPIGINVLRNDARAALAIAAVTGCEFIRVNVLSGVVASDQGMIEGDAAELLRERDRLRTDVAILADVHVKHAIPLSSRDLSLAIEEAATRARADGIIITGSTTGRSVDPEQLRQASHTAKHLGVPLFVGSGATAETLAELRPLVHGIIVGSALRKSGKAGAPLDSRRLKGFVGSYKKAGKSPLSKAWSRRRMSSKNS